MNAGETARFDCPDCNREFEVCLEPKAKGMKNPPDDTADVLHCPFCGADIESDEE